MPSSRFQLAASLVLVVGCASAADIGEACTDTSDCLGGLSCFVHEGAALSPVCMADCTLSTTRICEGGAVCTIATGLGRPADLGVCYLGGTAAAGATCTGNLDCERGSICVDVAGAQTCHRACTTGSGVGCVTGESCAPISGGGTNGYCIPT